MLFKLTARILALALVASACSWETRNLVPPDEPRVAETSVILDRNGAKLTELKAEQNRIPVELKDIPEIMQHAVIAIEDERFYEHSGYDIRGILRAFARNVDAGSTTEGASTITQQYVGNVFLDRTDTSATRKKDEILLARQFEQQFSKDYILERYLNWVYFGQGAYGVEAAALRYFDKSAIDLTIAEAALIAGLIQRPSALNPVDNRQGALRRRTLVLERMLANGYIDEVEMREADEDPMIISRRAGAEDESYVGGHFVEAVRAWFLEGDPELCPGLPETRQERTELLFTGGVTIKTTIDPQLQLQAEASVEAIIPDTGTNPDAAVVVLQTGTAEVLAMVGGRDFFNEETTDARVNLAMGKGRPAGSAMKPFALAAALDKGVPITRTYEAPSRITIDGWNVRGGSSAARRTLAEATQYSTNTVYAQMIAGDDAIITPQEFVDMAHALGLENDLPAVPAAVLGPDDVTMLGMATAYHTFANQGLAKKAIFVTEILATDGTVICRPPSNNEPTPVLSASVANQITWALEQVILDGTGTRAQIGRPAAGKTGTNQGNRDAAFVGYTPEFVTSVWVGFPGDQVEMNPPNTPIRVDGGTWPAEIWAAVMSQAHGDREVIAFPEPPPSSTTTTTTIFVPRAQAVTPTVIGLQLAEAQLLLEGSSFRLSVTEVENGSVPAGQIFVQSPPGGQSTPNRTIFVEVAIAPANPNVTVQRVTGGSAAEAIAVLQGQGFTVIQIEQVQPQNATPDRAGVVWKQEPRPGSEIQPGSAVTFWVNPVDL